MPTGENSETYDILHNNRGMLWGSDPSPKTRELVWGQAGLAAKDAAASTAYSLMWLLTCLGDKKGKDQELRFRVEAAFNEWGQDAMRGVGMGEFDIVNAAGWQFQEGVKYNGVPLTAEQAAKTKGGFWSVFVYHEDGSYEVMTPEYKDYMKYAGVYIAGQLATGAMVGGVGLKNLLKEIADAQGNVEKIRKIVELGAKEGFAVSQGLTVGGIQLYEGLRQGMVLSPEAVNQYAHMFDNPNMSAQDLKDTVLNIIYDYTGKEGSQAKSIYIPSPQNMGDTIKILEQLSRNNLDGYHLKHPNDHDPQHDSKIQIDNLDSVFNNPHFVRGTYSLIQKMLNGENLSDAEQLKLRVGLNNIGGKTLSLFGENGPQALQGDNLPHYSNKDFKELKKVASNFIINIMNKDGIDNNTGVDIIIDRMKSLADETIKIQNKIIIENQLKQSREEMLYLTSSPSALGIYGRGF
ncbi:MAG: hypothetical protein JNK24_02365 [Alphaproteobacteria bacterium]|nr:hypothetical protein [Alphaproteobacteria bacterium]